MNLCFIFNLVESIESHEELIFILHLLSSIILIPYTGVPAVPMFMTADKTLAKQQFIYHGLSTSGWILLNELDKLLPSEKYIIKPLWSQGSVGIDEDSVFVGNDVLYRNKISEISNKEAYFIERYIDGREFNISVLGGLDEPEVLPPAEIIFKSYPDNKPKVVGYRAKWQADSFEYHNTFRSFDFNKADSELLKEIKDLSFNCWKCFNMRGYIRVDIRVDKNNKPYILEINSNPCLSPDAGFMAAAERAGLTHKDVIERIIKDALK